MTTIVNLLSQINPFVKVIIISLFISLVTYFLLKKFKNKKILLLIPLIFLICYLKPLPFIKLIPIFLFPALIVNSNDKLKKYSPISYFFTIFLSLQFYLVLSYFFNPTIAFLATNIFLCLISLIKFKKIKYSSKESIDNLWNFINKLNLIDLSIIFTSFLIASQPQHHWDAVYANLYNARQYILNNSFTPLRESISSLFPQNAIVYYSYFFQAAKYKGFSISFLFPLIMLISIVKSMFKEFKFSSYLKFFATAFILTPIIIFQSSNGYYDLLTLSLIITATYSAFLFTKTKETLPIIISSFLIGFAIAIKYFPIFLVLIPIILIFKKFKFKRKKIYIISLLLMFLPISLWIIRTYLYTGSPVFPFAQYIFPTPSLWSVTDILENNFMIQTTLKRSTWLLGGFIVYPILTFLKTSSFLESTNYYSSVIYIFLSIPSFLFVIHTFFKFLKRKTVSSLELIHLLLFIAYVFVGVITRYYRYLWPYQYTYYFFSLILISKYFSKVKKSFFLIVSFFILMLNCFSIYKHFSIYPLITSRFLKPNYFYIEKTENDPIIFLNQNTSDKDTILDASNYFLPRINIKATSYLCNWYWIGWQNIFRTDKASETLSKFNYIITNNPIKESNNYCKDSIIKQKNLKQVYEDNYYLIHEVVK